VGPFLGGQTFGVIDNGFILPSIAAAVVVLISFLLILFIFSETLDKN